MTETRDDTVTWLTQEAYDRLKELEWMVGDWVDESESVKASSNVRWGDNKSFLIRTYQVEVKGEKATSGIVLIGWDPQTAQIKSWLFDADGGHGEGLWTRTDEKEWVVKAHGVLRQPRNQCLVAEVYPIVGADGQGAASGAAAEALGSPDQLHDAR